MLKGLRVASILFMFAFAAPAFAHHGWGYYDTATPTYLVGRVVAVNWRNPHPTVTLQVEPTDLPSDWKALPVPPELADLGFDATLAITKSITQAAAWVLDLAPINRLESWGLPRQPRVGNELVAVAFPSCSEPKVARPALIVLDGIGVRQQSVSLPAGCANK